MKAIKLLAIATTLSSGITMANTNNQPLAVGVELGTLGYGANIAWSANETAEVIVGWAGSNLSTDVDLNDNDSIINWNKVLGDEYEDFKGNLKLNFDFNNPYVGVNVRPFANRFTVGTGVIFQNNEISANLLANDDTHITINGTEYDVPQSGTVNIFAESSRSLAPYLTVGFKPNNNKRFGMFGEIGAVYTGDWKTRVEVSDDVATTSPDLQKELEDKIKEDNLSWYPIVKLGVTVRF